MSTLESTFSMLKVLPEREQEKIYYIVKDIYANNKSMAMENMFEMKSKNDILNDLNISRKQISEGKGINMKQAIADIGAKYGI